MDTRPLPDREYLERAFNRIRFHYWGTDLDAALAHPIRRVAIVAVARRMQRLAAPPPPVNTPKLATLPTPLTKRTLDYKQLASGEREDD